MDKMKKEDRFYTATQQRHQESTLQGDNQDSVG